MSVFSFICFTIIHFSKGSVVFAAVPQGVSAEVRKQIESNLNLDKPLLTQYFTWASGTIRGDFSYSLISGKSVNLLIKEHLPHTLVLTLTAFGVLFVLAIFLGILSVIYKDSLFDRCVNFICMSFFALPVFSLSLMLVLVFSVYLGVLPSSGITDIGFEEDLSNQISHLILPVLALVLSHLAVFLRFVRTALIESLNQSFIQAAFARGFSKMRIYFHFTLKHAFSPIITYFAASMVGFIMSAYVVENVFAYAGIGDLVIQSVLFKDYPVVLAVAILSVLMVVLVNLCAEILCKFINPRTSYA